MNKKYLIAGIIVIILIIITIFGVRFSVVGKKVTTDTGYKCISDEQCINLVIEEGKDEGITFEDIKRMNVRCELGTCKYDEYIK